MIKVSPAICLLGLGLLLSPPAEADDLDRRIDAIANRGIEYLRTRGQAEDGSFSGQTGAAVTGLCVRAILEHRPAATMTDPVIQQALAKLETHSQADGGIYAPGSRHRNYETSIAVLALAEADRQGRDYESLLRRAEAYLKDIQWDQGEGVGPNDTAYGGAGYGSSSRPDLSNTSFLIEALRELGNGPEDESIKKALQFVARTQNLPPSRVDAAAAAAASATNDTKYGDKIGDGGFYYTPAAGGQSKAGQSDTGGLRSYGSMTYAGLRSMIYAGLTADDPRVEAAMGFIRDHYTLEQNPGMDQAGLYYYYHTFAKALRAAGVVMLDDAQGNRHDWRRDLVEQLESTQLPDGSWVNAGNDRWMEGDKQLVTAYALLALAKAKTDNANHAND